MNRRIHLIVCERSGLWTARLRAAFARELKTRELSCRETRLLTDCRAELALAPESVLVVELTAGNVTGVLELLADVGWNFPRACVVVAAADGSDAGELLLREAGAVHVVTSPREAEAVARLVRRHAARLPRPRISFADQIWETLPWPEAAAN